MPVCEPPRSKTEPLEPRLLLSAGQLDPFFGNQGSIVLWEGVALTQDFIVDRTGGIIAASLVPDRTVPSMQRVHLRRLPASCRNGLAVPSSSIDSQPP